MNEKLSDQLMTVAEFITAGQKQLLTVNRSPVWISEEILWLEGIREKINALLNEIEAHE